jgi:hypothetical protein
VKVLARAHQNLIWERTRQVLRLRSGLREFFPAALGAYPDLHAPDTLVLLAAAPDPGRGGSAADRADRRGADRGRPSPGAGEGRRDRRGAAL